MKIRNLRRGFLLAILWSAVVPLAVAQQATGTVSGVVELDSAPVAGATVVFSSSARSDFEVRTTSDGEGYFEMAGLPIGRIEVRIYNSDEELIAFGRVLLETAGQTVTVRPEPLS